LKDFPAVQSLVFLMWFISGGPYPQCRINNSSKCSNCFRPRAFGGPAVFCDKLYLLYRV